jgi:2-phospho-L-lactate guanylyltransferase (CobY/MobA/RfbA family)
MLTILDGLTIYVATTGDLPKNNYTIIADEWKDINKVITRSRKMIKDDLLILPCDLPFVSREDIDTLLQGKTTIVPSQDGGTNALFLPAAVEIETQFGKNSFEKHLDALNSRNVAYEVYTSDNFRDIDTEEDIVWALEQGDSLFSRFLAELR